MTDAIMQQVSKQVKKAVEVASFVRPLPCFDYMTAVGCKRYRRHDPTTSPHCSERMQEAPHANGDRRSWEENRDHSIGANAHPNYRPGHGRPRGLRFLRKEREPAQPEPHEKECSTETVATIVDRYAEGITRKLRGHHHLGLPEEADISRKDIVPLVHPILGFGGQEVNPTGMIRLPLRFGGKSDGCSWLLFPPICGGRLHGHVSASVWQKQTAMILQLSARKQRSEKCPRSLVKGILRQTKSACHKFSLTLAMATCSSSTTDTSSESAGASNHDLAGFSTKARLVGASATRKSEARARVCTEGSPTAKGPSSVLPLDKRTPALRVVGADVAATSHPSSVRGRLRGTKWGRFKDPTTGFLLRGARGGAYRIGKSVSIQEVKKNCKEG
ncbi:hypothetical protein Cgig2_004636 [Carnegiea gigantea]|uniref:Uncharacterized protein n=1 Tax=Carnegiea gigantea TaxID=171969 RepID=A0A9Q1K148_9CARY|nr:hypothetical protein Cgig2_004636 [Carnegiea gigantea]